MVGADRVDADAVLAQLQCRDPGQADQAVLGRAIGRGERERRLGRLRGDIDDLATAALRDHGAGTVLGAQERAAQVDPQHRVPFGHFNIDQRLHQVADAGVVDQNVEAAEMPDGLRDHGLDLGFLQHIHRQGDAVATARSELGADQGQLLVTAHRAGRHFRAAALADVGQDHLAAFGQQSAGDTFAQAAAASGAGDQGDLAFQFRVSGHGSFP